MNCINVLNCKKAKNKNKISCIVSIIYFYLQKEVLNVSPLTRPQELPEYSNTSEKESAMTTMDGVYNHLNEKGETQDEDTYDHACAAATRSHLKDLDDYSNIHNMDDGTTMSGGTENDDYSTLEHN